MVTHPDTLPSTLHNAPSSDEVCFMQEVEPEIVSAMILHSQLNSYMFRQWEQSSSMEVMIS